MSKTRYAFLILILLGGGAIGYVLYKEKAQAPLGISFSPAFELMGKTTSSVNIAMTRILPINEMDEKEFGDAIAESYLSVADLKDKDYIYLNLLIRDLTPFSKKHFHYRVFVVSSTIPNAYALPGGIICVTKGLLNTLTSEAQIVSVLSHEMGHIECGHCFESIKYELTLKKVNAETVGQLADLAVTLFFNHTFSKTQEDKADEYGYSILLLTKYDPMAFSGSFLELLKYDGSTAPQSGDILRDYFDTHPPFPLRIHKFSQKASAWWRKHKNIEKRYIGIQNLRNRVPLSLHTILNEWI